jgi:hypothetical protein
MSDQTTRLQLPFLAAGQAQKHITVNESLLRLDALVQLAALSATTASQPAAPADGDIYITINGALAYYRDGVWEEIAPREVWLAHAADVDRLYCLFRCGLGRTQRGAGDLTIIGHSAVAAALTGTTAETVLASVSIPAGAMGPNGMS